MSTFCIYAVDLAAAAGHAEEVRALGHRAFTRDASTFSGPQDRENCDIVVLLDGDYPEIAAAYDGRAHILTEAEIKKAAAKGSKPKEGDDGKGKGQRGPEAGAPAAGEEAPAPNEGDRGRGAEAGEGDEGEGAEPGDDEVTAPAASRRKPAAAKPKPKK